jgi:hypothetical protein
MDIYKQESANYNAQMGGLFGLAGGLLKGGMGMMMMSDVREKENVVPLATVFAANPEGEAKELPIYEYSYKKDPTSERRVGPMAQDVEKIDKRAVTTRGGVKHIYPAKVMGSILRAS